MDFIFEPRSEINNYIKKKFWFRYGGGVNVNINFRYALFSS